MSIAEKLATIAENEARVYEAGRRAFMDDYQDNGNRVDYMRAFGGCGWNDKTFRPTQNIRPNNANNMFSDCDITDLKGLLESCGVELDFSGLTYNRISQPFSDSEITNIGVLDVSSCTQLTYLLWRALKLVNVDKVILSSDGNATFATTSFQSCGALKEIRFEGVIGQDINFSACPLSVASMKNIISHLMDLNGTGNEFTKLVKFSNACWNALEADSTAPSGSTWKDYVNSLGWNT